ncbi:MAG TPA: alpha/beta hydrolase [Solirubrobacteraceae bacterium]|nr:alpha/beta hydrolase [Solirubrobacteraceae bacterium]
MTHDLAFDTAGAMAGEPVRDYDIRGGGGIALRASEWGRPDGPPVLFVHGWSQCEMCWDAQVRSPLAERFRMVTFDNRGHGMSDKPLDSGCYADERLWADDLAAVIEETGLDRPVLVAWSYGGFIVGDYLRVYGDAGIAGVNLVGGAVLLRSPSFDHIGPGFLDNAMGASAPDLRTSINSLRRFLRACTAQPLPEDLWSAALCWSMAVPAAIRGALIAREIDDTDIYSRLSVPVLVTHGREDAIVLPSMAEHVLGCCNAATASWYDGAGHMPFVEDSPRFNLELAAFVDRATSLCSRD